MFSLASRAGADVLEAILYGLEQLPADAHLHARAAADALVAAPQPERAVFCQHLLTSPSPVVRPVAIDVLAREGKLTADDLRPHLLDANLGVLATAARAAAWVSPREARLLAPLLLRWMYLPDRAVA